MRLGQAKALKACYISLLLFDNREIHRHLVGLYVLLQELKLKIKSHAPAYSPIVTKKMSLTTQMHTRMPRLHYNRIPHWGPL